MFAYWELHDDAEMEEIAEAWSNAPSATPRTFERKVVPAPPSWGSHVDPSSQPQIPPAPLSVVPVSDRNIPVRGSAGAAAAYAMEMSAPAEDSVAVGSLRGAGSPAPATLNPAYQNVQGILTTEELVAEKREQYDNMVGRAPLMSTDDGETLPPPAMVPFLAQSVLPRIGRFEDGEVFCRVCQAIHHYLS